MNTANRIAPLVLSLGSVNADFQVRVDRRPEVSETLIASDLRRLSGGKAANVAFLARKLGADAQLFAHVGDDDLAEQALGPLRAAGVDLSLVRKVANAGTGISMISVPPDGKKGIILAPNANDVWSDADAKQTVDAIARAPAGSVLVVDCEVPVFVVEQALHAARQHGLISILDPSPANRVSDTLLRLADLLIPNAGEAEHLSSQARSKDSSDDPAPDSEVDSALGIAGQLRERGAATVCVKLRDGGCVVLTAKCAAHISATPVTVVDTTGAGDAFAGALAFAVLTQRPIVEAVRFAVAASHLAVTAFGSQAAYADLAETERMEQRLRTNPL